MNELIITDVQERIFEVSNPQPEYTVFKDKDGNERFVASPQNALQLVQYICEKMPWIYKQLGLHEAQFKEGLEDILAVTNSETYIGNLETCKRIATKALEI